MKTEQEVSRALETYDHLLWEVVIRNYDFAISKAFRRKGNQVSVVYKIRNDRDSHFIGNVYRDRSCSMDPRDYGSENIGAEIRRWASLSLPIKKFGVKTYGADEAKFLCSHVSYWWFLEDMVKPSSRACHVLVGSRPGERFLRQGEELAYTCDFVEIGKWGNEVHVRCPCVGEHLANTNELQGFQVNLSEPERVGEDTYEFKFEIAK